MNKTFASPDLSIPALTRPTRIEQDGKCWSSVADDHVLRQPATPPKGNTDYSALSAVATSRSMKSVTGPPPQIAPQYHRNSYYFVFSALQHTQEGLHRTAAHVLREEEAHISGRELCEGFRDLALRKFGMLATTVLNHWGVRSTQDIGRIVFELIERGEMRKTDDDALDDFDDVYDFEEAFCQHDQFDLSKAFRDFS